MFLQKITTIVILTFFCLIYRDAEAQVLATYQLIKNNALYELTPKEEECLLSKTRVDSLFASCLGQDPHSRFYPPQKIEENPPIPANDEKPWYIEAQRIDKDIGYLRIKSFVTLARYYASQELKRFQKHKIKNLIIDLRGNQGLLTSAAVEFLDLFSPEESIPVLEIRGRGGKFLGIKYTTRKGPYRLMNIIVLVDKQTASAAEIAAGNLQLWGAKVVGINTACKGSGQIILVTDDGGFFGFTDSQYYFSNGVTPEGIGIIPDVIETDPDTQLTKAISILKGKH